MKYIQILIGAQLLIFTMHYSNAQSSHSNNGISTSYFNNLLVNPGLRIGYETSIWNKNVLKPNQKTKIRSLVLKTNLGFYSHIRNNTGVFFNTHIGLRLTSNSGFYAEPLHVGIGYLQTFLNGKTYSVATDGTVSKLNLASNSNLMLPYVSVIGLGYDFRKKRNEPIGVFLSLDTFVQSKVNTKTILRMSVPIGFTYYFK